MVALFIIIKYIKKDILIKLIIKRINIKTGGDGARSAHCHLALDWHPTNKFKSCCPHRELGPLVLDPWPYPHVKSISMWLHIPHKYHGAQSQKRELRAQSTTPLSVSIIQRY